jgi:hypothetical protein
VAYFIEDEGIEISGETKVYNGLEIDGVAGCFRGRDQLSLLPDLWLYGLPEV